MLFEADISLHAEARCAYDAWFFAVDGGVVFRARTTEVACVVVQFDFQAEDPALAARSGRQPGAEAI